MNKTKSGFKNLYLPILFVLLGGIGVQTSFAEERAANVRNNWISGEVSLIGLGLRYERMLGSHFSLGVNAYANTLIAFSDVGIDAFVRFYPQGKNFFTGVGFGQSFWHNAFWGYIEKMEDGGVAITPEFGWKIDVSDEGGFYLQPGIKLPIVFGTGTRESFWTEEIRKEDIKYSVGFVIYLGMGIAF